ncbi:WhiB family transcriptional regulator [Streptomyces chartreusis]
MCSGCGVRAECPAYAMDQRIQHGVWGCMTEREHWALLRRQLAVTSWRHLLETARAEHERTHDATATMPQAG